MISTFELDPEMNQHARYLGQGSFRLFVHSHAHTHTDCSTRATKVVGKIQKRQ